MSDDRDFYQFDCFVLLSVAVTEYAFGELLTLVPK